MPRIMNKTIWPFQREIKYRSNEQSDEMYNWCKEKIAHWYLNGNTFCFNDEKDFLMFCLRWS